MAIITWKNVPTPDIGDGMQQGIRTAGDLLNRALGNATAGVDQMKQAEAERKAAEVATADKFALQQMLAVQDPAKYRAGLADGSLAAPARAAMSPEMMLRMEARQDFLQGRADADTARADADYTRTKSRTRDQKLTAAQGLLDQALAKGTYSPQMAQEIAAKANLDPEDQFKFAQQLKSLYIDTSGHQANARAKKNDLLLANAATLADEMRRVAANDPQAANALWAKEKNPQVRLMAEEIIKKADGAPHAQRVAGIQPTFGLDPSVQKQLPEDVQVDIARSTEVLEKEKEQQTRDGPTRAILATKGMETLGEGDVATQLAADLKKAGAEDVEPGKITMYIKKLTAANPKATPAQVGALLKNHLEGDNLTSMSDVADNLDTSWNNLEGDVAQLGSAQTKVDLFSKKERQAAKLQEVSTAYAAAKFNYETQTAIAANDPKAGPGLEKARKAFEKEQKRLNDLRQIK